MPTWLRLASVGVAGLEPAASRSQSGRSTKLTYTPLCCYLICVRDPLSTCERPSRFLSNTRLFDRPVEGPVRGALTWPSITHRVNHIPRTRATSTRKQVNHVTHASVGEPIATATSERPYVEPSPPLSRTATPRPNGTAAPRDARTPHHKTHCNPRQRTHATHKTTA